MATSHSKQESYRLFDAIAGRYDLINSILSFGLHHLWRAKLRTHALAGAIKGTKILDLASGTADVALTLGTDDRVEQIIGIDPSKEMLAIGREKVSKAGLSSKIILRLGDANRLSEFKNFDTVTMSFGIRNVADPQKVMKEIYATLKPGGQVLFLEFSLPRPRWFRAMHLFYLRHLLPKIGKWLSGHDSAYRYLNETIETFPYRSKFRALMETAGFRACSYHSLSGGIVCLYRGIRP